MTDDSIDTADLIRRSQDGDRDAQGRLVERIDPQVRQLAASLRVPTDDRSDFAQDVKHKVVAKLSTLRKAGAFRAWVRRIGERAIAQVRRAWMRRGVATERIPDEFAASETDMQRKLLRRQLRELVEQFPEPRRTIFRLHLDLGLNYREITERLNQSGSSTQSDALTPPPDPDKRRLVDSEAGHSTEQSRPAFSEGAVLHQMRLGIAALRRVLHDDTSARTQRGDS